jgi:hypothetical protein
VEEEASRKQTVEQAHVDGVHDILVQERSMHGPRETTDRSANDIDGQPSGVLFCQVMGLRDPSVPDPAPLAWRSPASNMSVPALEIPTPCRDQRTAQERCAQRCPIEPMGQVRDVGEAESAHEEFVEQRGARTGWAENEADRHLKIPRPLLEHSLHGCQAGRHQPASRLDDECPGKRPRQGAAAHAS